MTPADRLAFWTQVHPRLARLDNRLDQAALAKVMGELHAKVPMVAIGDPDLTAGKIEIAEHNAAVWTTVREHTLATVEEKRKLGLAPDGFASEVKYVAETAKIRGVSDLKVGDVIVAVDGKERDELANTADLYVKLRYRAGDSVTLDVLRDGRRVRMPLHTHSLSFRK